MANTGTIQQFGQSTTGKPKVQIDGQWFFMGKTDMSTVNVGERISYESRSSNFNGKELWFIEKWGKVPATSNGVHAQPPAQTRAVTAPPSGMSEGERLCVSNWIAAALSAKTLASPDEIDIWVKASLAAIRGTTRQPGEDDE